MDGIEKRARELLAAHVGGQMCTPEMVMDPSVPQLGVVATEGAVRAIMAALTPPDGYVLVPVEPTEEMISSGAESRPMRPFTPLEEWEAFEAMTGCEQGWHKAKLCYAAMLSARPNHSEGLLGIVAVPEFDIEDLLAIVTKARLVLHAKGVTDLAEKLGLAHDGLSALLTGSVNRTNLRMTSNWYGRNEETDR
ncbi:hypothetical protein U4I65_02295 [Stenotrophomonas maltophilia]|nr:hypothetical protein [Stenotrophomonas maltophilia]